MNAGEFFEFSIAHDRKYTLDHLWVQLLDDGKKKDEEEMTVKIGISEFIRAEYGDIVKVVLSKPEDDSEFQVEPSEEGNDDDAISSPLSSIITCAFVPPNPNELMPAARMFPVFQASSLSCILKPFSSSFHLLFTFSP